MVQRFFALLFLLVLPISTFAFTVPAKPTGFVQDYASMLSADQVKDLETKLESFEKNTTNEIAVVTIQSLDGDVIENVAQEIFTKWGIGKEGKNNGVLLLISLSDRKTRIQTGYGEGDLTDIATSYIQSDIITPAFRAGDYYKGIDDAVTAMMSALTPGGIFVVPEDYEAESSSSDIPWNFFFILFIVILQIITSVLARSKSWWGGGIIGGVAGLIIWHYFIASILFAILLAVVLIAFGLVFDYLVSKAHTQGKKSGNYPWWFGGGGFGGGGR